MWPLIVEGGMLVVARLVVGEGRQLPAKGRKLQLNENADVQMIGIVGVSLKTSSMIPAPKGRNLLSKHSKLSKLGQQHPAFVPEAPRTIEVSSILRARMPNIQKENHRIRRTTRPRFGFGEI
jgi:hypothetical protein